MRLIDGDAIAPKLEGKFNQDMVRYAPTLDYKDLVPQGEWLKTEMGLRENINTGEVAMVYTHDCSVCGWHTGNQAGGFSYCPNCGARMKGGE